MGRMLVWSLAVNLIGSWRVIVSAPRRITRGSVVMVVPA
jgi:hypothetical protein